MKNIFVIIVILLTGCALKEKKQVKKVVSPRFSAETEQEFSSIENQDSPYSESVRNAALKYRKMREQSWENYLQENSDQIDQAKPQKLLRYKPTTRQKYRPKRNKPSLNPQQLQELEIQSKQMMNYFCMKNRNRGQYGDQEYCQNHTQNILRQCKSQNSGQLSKSVVRCLKSKLNV